MTDDIKVGPDFNHGGFTQLLRASARENEQQPQVQKVIDISDDPAEDEPVTEEFATEDEPVFDKDYLQGQMDQLVIGLDKWYRSVHGLLYDITGTLSSVSEFEDVVTAVSLDVINIINRERKAVRDLARTTLMRMRDQVWVELESFFLEEDTLQDVLDAYHAYVLHNTQVLVRNLVRLTGVELDHGEPLDHLTLLANDGFAPEFYPGADPHATLLEAFGIIQLTIEMHAEMAYMGAGEPGKLQDMALFLASATELAVQTAMKTEELYEDAALTTGEDSE